MRIISGKYRGRKLAAPTDDSIRPTTDKMRERVFSMLQHSRYPDLYGARVLDVFAGTGALGLEALSRGASHVTFVEKSTKSIALLNKNIAAMKVEGDVSVVKKRATSLPPTKEPCAFIFLDPPYSRNLVRPTLDCLLEGGWLADGRVIICEMHKDDELTLPEGLELIDERSQGIQRVVFLA